MACAYLNVYAVTSGGAGLNLLHQLSQLRRTWLCTACVRQPITQQIDALRLAARHKLLQRQNIGRQTHTVRVSKGTCHQYTLGLRRMRGTAGSRLGNAWQSLLQSRQDLRPNPVARQRGVSIAGVVHKTVATVR